MQCLQKCISLVRYKKTNMDNMADGQNSEKILTDVTDASLTDSMEEVIDKFTNVTIGGVIDYTKEKENVIFLILKERKQKKQACNKDSFMKDCLQRLNIDEGTFTYCLTQLLNKNLVCVNSRAGKLVYTPENTEVSEGDTSDFVDFKKFVCKKFIEFDRKIDTQNELIDKLGNIVETKDTVINLLREELKQIRNLFEKTLDKIVCYRENHCCVTSDKTSLTNERTSKISSELSISQTPIIFNEPLTPKVKEKSIQLIADQLIAVRLKKHNDFLTSINSSDNVIKDTDDVKETDAIKLDNSVTITATGIENNSKEQISCINYTAIIGDSMINGINANGFKRELNVKIKPFGGSTSADLLDHIKPTLRKNPKNIILHVGTNDLTNNIDTIQNFKEIIKLIRTKSPNSNVAVSNVVIRADKKNMVEKVQELNKKIKELCEKENIDVINKSNLNDTHLSKRKLHLNQKGLSILAKNFISYLN